MRVLLVHPGPEFSVSDVVSAGRAERVVDRQVRHEHAVDRS